MLPFPSELPDILPRSMNLEIPKTARGKKNSLNTKYASPSPRCTKRKSEMKDLIQEVVELEM